jgi:hypothetical protein
MLFASFHFCCAACGAVFLLLRGFGNAGALLVLLGAPQLRLSSARFGLRRHAPSDCNEILKVSRACCLCPCVCTCFLLLLRFASSVPMSLFVSMSVSLSPSLSVCAVAHACPLCVFVVALRTSCFHIVLEAAFLLDRRLLLDKRPRGFVGVCDGRSLQQGRRLLGTLWGLHVLSLKVCGMSHAIPT